MAISQLILLEFDSFVISDFIFMMHARTHIQDIRRINIHYECTYSDFVTVIN